MAVEWNVKVKGSELKREHDGENDQREAVMFVRTLQELSHSMEAIEQHKVQENQSETSVTTEKDCTCSLLYIIYYKYHLPPLF